MPPWVIIDCNYICHVAKYKLDGLSFQDKKTGIIFGFLRSLLEFSDTFPKSKFIFCWDSNVSLRKSIYPEYKNKRNGNKTEEEKELDKISYNQFLSLKEYVLPAMGFKNIFEQEGYESDDVIASVIRSINNKETVLVANDKDLYQLLDLCIIWNPSKKEFYSCSDFEEEWNVLPFTWANVKAIAGCTTDCVKGVEGVGEKTAIKFLKGELSKGAAYNRITSEEGKELRRCNDHLVRLPFQGTKTFPIRLDEKISCKSFIKICDEFGFQSFLKDANLNKWYNNFGMWDA